MGATTKRMGGLGLMSLRLMVATRATSATSGRGAERGWRIASFSCHPTNVTNLMYQYMPQVRQKESHMSPIIKLTTASGNTPKSIPKVIHGFDRIILWSDHSEFPGSLGPMRKYCTDIKIFVEQMPYQARWKSRIELFQPTIKCLRLFAEALGNNVSVMVSYVEISLDFPAESDGQALLWRDAFLGGARMKYQGQSVEFDDNKKTCYFGRRVNAAGNKRGKVLAVYADRPSKILNARPTDDAPKCLHLEMRATGIVAVSGVGINTIQDLIEFRHKAFWAKQLTLFELPKKTELGRLLANANDTEMDVSTTAFRGRAARWIKNASIDHLFVMHNALLGRLDIAQKLKIVPFGSWVKKTIR